MSSQLSPRSEEFRRVEYLLKLSLRTSLDIHDVSAWVFTSPHQAARFQDRTRGMQVLHSWVETSALDQTNNLETLHARGFVFPAGRGMVFTTGTLSEEALVPDGRARRFLLCQVGVGRSFVSDNPDKREPLPPGFDSVFLAQRQSDGPSHVYRHEYILMDPSQVIPLYLVQFFGGPPPPDGSSHIPPALTDGRYSGSNAPPSTSVQALYDRYDFFDPVWYVPVSVRDKMVGSHSTGEAAQHKLISIGDAYDAALSESLKPDALVGQRQQELKQALRAVDAKLRDVNRNSAEVEELIYKTLQDALFQLQDLTQEKLNVLLAEEVELRRQLEHVDWIETFLDQQREEASPPDFLSAWKCHVQLRADMARSKLATFDVLGRIEPDLELVGQVGVVKRSLQLLQEPPALADAKSGGEGSMEMHGGPQPVTQQQLAGGGEENGIAADADVSRAWAEALQMQVELDRSALGAGAGASHTRLEMPPTPPSQQRNGRGGKAQQAKPAPEQFSQFRMSREAARRLKTQTPDASPFDQSRLISHAAPAATETAPNPLSPAQVLALCLPSRRPRIELLFASWKEGEKSIPKMLQVLPRHEVDEAGVTMEITEFCPTILVVKANGRVFGGFANDTWRSDGLSFGDNKSFLFSLDEDVKIPFIGRETLLPPPASATQPGMRTPKFGVLVSNSQLVQFGVGDLVFANDFRECSSELEHSFGIGLDPDSDAARNFLAGASRFACDEVELWACRE